jgi:hypothetical protein
MLSGVLGGVTGRRAGDFPPVIKTGLCQDTPHQLASRDIRSGSLCSNVWVDVNYMSIIRCRIMKYVSLSFFGVPFQKRDRRTRFRTATSHICIMCVCA